MFHQVILLFHFITVFSQNSLIALLIELCFVLHYAVIVCCVSDVDRNTKEVLEILML